MKKTIGLLIVAALALSGCKMENTSRVKQTQLLGVITAIDATTRIEVPGCNDFQDKSKPSRGLVEATELVLGVFPGAVYDECKNENMKSVAIFTTPLEVGMMPPDGKQYEAKGVSLVRNGGGEVFFAVSKDIRGKITQTRNKAMTSDLALKVAIRFTNDTDKDITIFPHAIFVDGDPFAGLPRWGNNVVIKAGKPVTLTLSDIASEFAIQHGVAPIFTERLPSPEEVKK